MSIIRQPYHAEELTLEERVRSHSELLHTVQDGQIELARQVAEMVMTTREMRKEFPRMIAEGIVTAAASPDTWAAMRSGMKREARDAAGNVILGTIKSIPGKVFWFVLVLWILYSTGGLPAVLSWLKFQTVASP